eukprot:SAG31_NODE_20596_length_570_cov_0.658174_1_plen_21_part_10
MQWVAVCVCRSRHQAVSQQLH